MTDGIMQYFAKIGLDASAFLNGMTKSQSSVLAFYRDVSVTMNMTIQIFDRVAASVQRLGQSAQELRDLSITTGLTVQQLQKLQYASALSGTPFYSVTTSLNKVTLSMVDAKDAASEAGKAFADLGVDPTGKTPQQVFDETAVALMGMKDETRRNSDAMTIYGRTWKDMLPFMDSYIRNQKDIQASPTLSDKENENLEKAKEGWDKLGYRATVASGNIISAILDAQDAANKVNPVNSAFGWAADQSAWDKGPAPLSPEQPSQFVTEIPLAEAVVKPETDWKDALDDVISAMGDYEAAIQDVIDAKNKLNDIDKSYSRSLQTVNIRDVEQVRNIMIKHQYDVEDQTARVGSLQKTAVASEQNVRDVAGGKNSAGIVLNINNMTLNGDKSFEKEIQNQRIRAGVR